MSCCVITGLMCCGQYACRCCCSTLPSISASLSSRLAYLTLLISGVISSCIFMSPLISKAMSKIMNFCHSAFLYIPASSSDNCENIENQISRFVGYVAVYRICFGFAVFFFVMMILMIGVKSSKDLRNGLQNGFWFFKSLVIFGIILGAFFIHNQGFEMGMLVIGYIGGFCFYIVKMVIVVDFSYKWTESWMEKYEETSNKLWFVGIIFFFLFFFACFIALVVVLYIFYAYSGCHLHIFFVTFNFILCLLLILISIIPKLKERNPRSGLLQSSIVSLYIMYITWTAMSSSSTCNPLAPKTNGTFTVNNQEVNNDCFKNNFNYDVIVPLVILLLSIIYTGFSKVAGHAGDTVKGTPSKEEENLTSAPDNLENSGGQQVLDDNSEKCSYNYSLFHLMFLMATLFLMMTLTHWMIPNKMDCAKDEAKWVKIASSWVGMLIYLWILIAPFVLRNRVFD